MPFDLSAGAALWIALAGIGAAFVRGYSGFGFSALLVASAGLVADPLDFIAVVVLCEIAMSLQLWRQIRHGADWRRAGLLLAGAAVGLPLGLWGLTSLPESGARVAISLLILAMCGLLLAGWRMARPAGRGLHLAAGVVSGVANAPGMGGLPVAAFFAAQPIPAHVFRATLLAYFPVLEIGSMPLYWLNGMVSWNTIGASLLLLPFVALGNWLGGRHFLRTDPGDFRRLAILLLAALAATGLVKNLL